MDPVESSVRVSKTSREPFAENSTDAFNHPVTTLPSSQVRYKLPSGAGSGANNPPKATEKDKLVPVANFYKKLRHDLSSSCS